MSMKALKKIAILVILIIIGVFAFKSVIGKFRNTDTIINKIACRAFELNSITVVTDDDVELGDIEIKVGTLPVFILGEQVNRVGQFYGRKTFLVYHKDLLIAEIGHRKTNNWHSNDYEFGIARNKHNFTMKHVISGLDAQNDNYQKRYIYDEHKKLIEIAYMTENGAIYTIEKVASD